VAQEEYHSGACVAERTRSTAVVRANRAENWQEKMVAQIVVSKSNYLRATLKRCDLARDNRTDFPFALHIYVSLFA
jgi:hypothetical protein